PEPLDEPEINYLAKDYASFRTLILDRLSLIMPDWQDRYVADLGTTLVELLAYTGDHLSYYQDAVGTEAYLDTARQRISVRRHVRLVDYHLHQGCNARAWLFVEFEGTGHLSVDSEDICFITSYPGAPQPGQPLQLAQIPDPQGNLLVFEPLVERPDKKIHFCQSHNTIHIHTWDGSQCCLPRGATGLTLVDGAPQLVPQSEPSTTRQPAKEQVKRPSSPVQCDPTKLERVLQLEPGDFLLLEEVLGPATGSDADADPEHRHVVRLTGVNKACDPLSDESGKVLPVLQVEWSEADALPFPLCVSAIGKAPECRLLNDVSVARGNVLLVDHGETIDQELLGTVEEQETIAPCEDVDAPGDVSTIPQQFRPCLKHGPLTHSQPLPESTPNLPPASELLEQRPRESLPQICLSSVPSLPDGTTLFSHRDVSEPTGLILRLRAQIQWGAQTDEVAISLLGLFSFQTRRLLAETRPDNTPVTQAEEKAVLLEMERLREKWIARPTLLNSRSEDTHFVVETDNDGVAHLRLGDGELGRRPQAGEEFKARYRVGNGPAGNVGEGTIKHPVFRKTAHSGISLRPRNPFPATGGAAPEPLAEAKRFAPHLFRNEIQRAIIPDDYARLVERGFPDSVQRAAATLRWTGSWQEVLVAIDPLSRVNTPHELAQLLEEIRKTLRLYRRIGHDVVVQPARYVPLDLAMTVCVHPEFLRGHVKAALLAEFSNRTLPDGRRGFFHRDNLTFGDGVHLSRLVATAQAVSGVESVSVTKLERLFEGPNGEIDSGFLPLGPLEIAVLDQDPSFPENGKLELDMQGGR
ncbi:MAG: putative baseplate assembly protein, partial [Planctomycetota bacterium]